MPDAAPHLLRIVDGVPRVVADDWRLVDDAAQWDALAADSRGEALAAVPGSAADRVILPLELALAQRERLVPGRRWGVRLAPGDEPARVVELFPRLQLIGIDFPKFTDGRGYSSAVLLRTRLGWRGELRALGDILQDQLFALRRVGFDSFALRADRDPQQALRGFAVFSGTYQGSVDEPAPAYRRHGSPA